MISSTSLLLPLGTLSPLSGAFSVDCSGSDRSTDTLSKCDWRGARFPSIAIAWALRSSQQPQATDRTTPYISMRDPDSFSLAVSAIPP